MKKYIICMGLVILLVMTTAMALAQSQPEATAIKVKDAIVLDGTLDEWDKSSPIILDQESQIVRDLSFWQGVQDLSAKFYVMWDEENLYLGAEITEDTPFGALEMLPLDREDNIELFISTNPDDDPARTAYSATDFKVYLIMDGMYWDTAIDRSMVEDRQRFVSKGMDGGENVLEGYECAAQHTTDGIAYEAKIPWSCFSNEKIEQFVPQTGDMIQFNLLVTDISYACPGTEYIPQMAWTGTLDINLNPSLWGRLTFAE